jgi:hypothetical protein
MVSSSAGVNRGSSKLSISRFQQLFSRLLFRVLPLALILAAMWPQASAQAKIADCLFVVEGVVFIDGPCEFHYIGRNGSFNFDDNKLVMRCPKRKSNCFDSQLELVRSGTFGQLLVTSPKRGIIYWNSSVMSRAQDELPKVVRKGACWIGTGVKLCAW